MAVSLHGTDDPGHPLEGRIPAAGTVVVLLTSEACALDTFVRDLAGRAAGDDGQLVVVDVAAEPQTAQHFKVRVLPTWQVWVDGQLRTARTGAVSVAAVEELLGVGGIDRRRGMRRRR